MADLEPFPAISPHPYLVSKSRSNSNSPGTSPRPRRRRTSSGLPGEPRGDTGAAALSTLSEQAPEALSGQASLHRTASEKARPRSKRRKVKTLFKRWKNFSMRHTWVNPLILCILILNLYAFNPTPSNPIHSALTLSYPMPRPPGTDPSTPLLYGKGGRDFAFVAFYTVVLSFIREFLMQRFIRPLAIYAGIKGRAKQSRFMEQFYTAMYFAIFGPFGLYVMSRSPVWYFNTAAMFEGFPHKTHEGLFKAYYLLQASYWSQQAIVLLLQLEKPRKDFKELVGHHIITIALIWLSYRFHFTYMGLAVYITHDVSDFFLATSKVLYYLESPIVGPYYGFFILVWAYGRHYLNLRILYATLTTFRTVGPFELNWEMQQYKCRLSQYITFGLLASLQSVNIFWFFLILKIAKNYVIAHNQLEDERSEYGESDGEVGVESTGEKREKIGALMQNGNGFGSGPMVLLNGVPVEDELGGGKVTGRRRTTEKQDADMKLRR